VTVVLAPEWARVELLARCLATAREGDAPDDATLERLRAAQDAVDAARAGDAWAVAGVDGLTATEHDVLACVLAPEADPRIGWRFAALQPAAPSPYPSAALVQDLLVVEPGEAGPLHAALAASAPLRRARAIEVDGSGPYAPLRPSARLAARVLGRPGDEAAPPGAVRVAVHADWDELVLPPERLAALREFLAWVRHRDTVVRRWGARPVGGPVALFAGPSGTGKTFAAAVLAGELGWPLYRVDLGLLVSKYIGETEKNLNALFDAAHGRELVLQFDEADSLFGRRGDVRDARDRYANLEVSHLLARIEQHDGPCVLTTNLRRHLDPAFARRFQLVLDFPRPGPVERERLWRTLLPPRAPLDPRVDLAAAGAIPLTGGGIRNAALHAAVLAVDAGEAIGPGHLALAAWRELGKDGSEVAPSALGPLAAELPAQLRRDAGDAGDGAEAA
jgi:hypothetical protein